MIRSTPHATGGPGPGPGPAVRGVVFVILMYALMGLMGVAGLPLLVSTRAMRWWQKSHNRIAFAMARGIVGLRIEIRGTIPDGNVIVVAKHQSLLDVLALYNALPEPRFVMKRELLFVPVFCLYARRTGAISIDRSAGRAATEQLIAAFSGASGQVVIYPQGTRVAPGDHLPYRRGAARLAAALDRPVVLAATNAGVFWPRRGVRRYSGTAVIAFLGPTEAHGGDPGLMDEIERRIEDASKRLLEEAGAAPSGTPGSDNS